MKILKRKLAITLAMTLLLSSISASQVFATDNMESKVSEVESVEEQKDSLNEMEETSDDSEALEHEDTEEVEIKQSEESTEEVVTTEIEELSEKPEVSEKKDVEADVFYNDEIEDTDTDQTMEQRLNYVYVESPYLETPSEQNIVVSWGDGTEDIENMRIVLENSQGSEEEWTSTKDIGKLHLFTKEYDESVRDEYEVTKVCFVQDGLEQEYNLTEINDVSVNFGVNKEYEGYGENIVPLSKEETADIEENVEATVVNLEEEGEIETASNIAEALTVAGEELATVPMMAEGKATARSNETVIALDPGHDATHAGAGGNGLREEVLSLKIAKYAKAKLEKWGQARIYMVRDSACPYPGTSSGECNAKRVQAAKAQGATIYVSFHLNSSTSSAAAGAEIIHPHTNWKPEIGTEGKNLAQAIQKELVALGLKDRGVYSKGTQIDTYPDGSKQDWYQIPRECKKAGFPGIIIEHAFISNANDANKYLKTEAGLKKLGEADAAGIIKYMENSNRWITQNGKKYYSVGGKLVKGEKKINGKWYYFDEKDGAMVTGLVSFKNKTVYYAITGEMVYGEQKIGDKWYYFQPETGAMQKSTFVQLPGKRVYYNEKGEMVYGPQTIEGKEFYFEYGSGRQRIGLFKTDKGTICYLENGGYGYGEQRIDGKWYYFDEKTGFMVTGLKELPGKTVYYNTTGEMHYGEKQIDGKWYYFDEVRGAMTIGWHKFSNKTSYYDLSGERVHGERNINGKWYYFDEVEGAMTTGWHKFSNKTVYYAPTGEMVYGEKNIGGKWYHFDEVRGTMTTGWHEFSNKTVYYAPTGEMVYGEKNIEGKWYHFDEVRGTMTTGWHKFSNKTVYYAPTGEIVYGEKNIGGKWYHFDEVRGAMTTGWHKFSNKTVYYAPTGEMVYGEKNIEGKWYHFDEVRGAMTTGWHKFSNKTVYYAPTGEMVYGEKYIDGRWYYFKEGTGQMMTNVWNNGHYYNDQGIRQ